MCHWGCNDLKTKVIFPYYSLIFVTTLLTNGQYLLSSNLQRGRWAYFLKMYFLAGLGREGTVFSSL